MKSLVADQDDAATFFCGGSRNRSEFIGLFDGVFVPEADLGTLRRRLDQRPDDEWGGKQSKRDLIVGRHQTREDVPQDGSVIDAIRPLALVIDEIIRRAGQ